MTFIRPISSVANWKICQGDKRAAATQLNFLDKVKQSARCTNFNFHFVFNFNSNSNSNSNTNSCCLLLIGMQHVAHRWLTHLELAAMDLGPVIVAMAPQICPLLHWPKLPVNVKASGTDDTRASPITSVAAKAIEQLADGGRRHKHFSPFTVSGSNLANITICLWRTFGIANLWGRLACSRHSLLIFSWCNGTKFRYSFRLWGSSLTWWRAVKFMCISSSIYGKANTLKTYLQIFSNIFLLSSDKNFMHFSIFQISLGYFS